MEKRKIKLKKFSLHPVTSLILLTLLIMIISAILSTINISVNSSNINSVSENVEQQLVTVKNMLSFDGLRYMISNASKNFISFTALSTILITLIGIGILEYTGLANAFLKRTILKVNPKIITFIIILLAIFSSIINEVGYTIMIPIGALLFLLNGRNPLAGICAAYAGVSFGYGTSFFVGSMDISLIPYTKIAAQLIDSTYHVSMTSNLFIMIISCIVLAIVGTIITEKFVVKKIGRYVNKTRDELGKTKEIEYLDLKYEEQKKIKEETNEKKGLRYAAIAGIIITILFVYSLIPGLPLSGMLLDNNEYAYVNKLFGDNSYFQEGFTYLVAIFFIVTGLFYGIGAKTIRSDKDFAEAFGKSLSEIGSLIVLIFFASQFIAVYKESNINIVLVAMLTNFIKILPFSGLPLIIICILIIALSSLIFTTPVNKWAIMAPTVVPLLMQQNISPQFTQFIFRASDSMLKGITPLLAYFVIYVGYLNIYNKDKNRPITIRKAISYIMPYAVFLSITWIIILLAWYIIGLPLGPGVYPTM